MRTILIACLAVFAPLSAGAQTQHKKPAPPRAVHINIDDPDRIEGETPRGDGEVLTVTRRAKQSSLIKVRADFRAEMMTTASGL